MIHTALSDKHNLSGPIFKNIQWHINVSVYRKELSSSFGARDRVKPPVPPNRPSYKVLNRSGSAKEPW